MRETNVASDLWRDLQHAARVLRRSPGFTALAALTLALGIGATTAIFSVVYGVLLKPLPFPEPERLVGVYHRSSGPITRNEGPRVINHGEATFFHYRDHQRAFQDIGAWDPRRVSITGRGEPEQVDAIVVTDRMLPLLGVKPLLGRLFTREEDTPGSIVRVLLTYGYWRRAFAGREDVLGQRFQIDGRPAEVTAVLPASFKFLRFDPAVLLPMQLDPADARDLSFGIQVVARLKPGVTYAQADADMARMIPRLADLNDGFNEWQLQPNIRPLAQDVIGDVGQVLWILLATVGLVLLIACANVANLFLVRAEGRQTELALRAALGASRLRIARGLLSESLILGLAGGAAGLVLAQAGIVLLRGLAPAALPRVEEIALHPTVLLFTFATSIVTSLLFGLIPVIRFGTPSGAALKEGGRTASDGPARQGTRNTLVVAEVALSFVLLVISGLMVRTFLAMQQVPPGFVKPEEVQTFRIAVPPSFGNRAQAARLHESIAERLRRVPGVASVGLASSVTMDSDRNRNALWAEHIHGRDTSPPGRRFKTVAPGYFETMGNPVVAGRAITWDDIHEGRRVVMVAENVAREHWGGPKEALGKRVRNQDNWFEIVGVVGDERHDGLNQPATDFAYWPLVNDTFTRPSIAYAVRSPRVGAPGFLRELQQAVWSVNPNLPLGAVQTLDDIQAGSMAATSFAMVMLAIAASVALLLGVVGIYGAIAYVAAQRTREIGIRMAHGAEARDVHRLFLRYGLWLTGAGVALGVGLALSLTRVMSALLFGVSPTDPATYVAVAAVLTAVALLATWLPARRAARLDPMAALRLH
jgi:predicted permease